MEYYYTEHGNISSEEKKLVITGMEHRHLIKVLRKSKGDKIDVTDGILNVYHCKISEITKDSITCEIISEQHNIYEPRTDVNLFMAPLRNLSRFEFAIEKAVELGVKSINPVITEFTVAKGQFSVSKMARFRKIIISAMEQSQRCFLPEMHNSVNFRELLVKSGSSKNKVVLYESAGSDEKAIPLNEKEIN